MAQPQCPLCEAPINEDFGLIECSSCGAQLVVHMDGHVEHSGSSRDGFASDVSAESGEAESSSVAEAEESPSFIDQIGDFEITDQTQSKIAAEPAAEAVDLGSGGTDHSFNVESPEASMPIETPMPDESADLQEPALASEPEEMNFDMAESGVETEQYVSPSASPSQVDSPELQDVAQFANSSESGGREGNLKYSIFVSGIDTADVREAFKEALTDKKLLWDLDEILKKIKLGQVKIENVSSTKAYVVVTRLKHLPVKVTWEQHAIHQG